MGRYKYDAFDSSKLSSTTINAIKADLIKGGTDPDCYDWNVLQIRIKRANMMQRHRFKDTIRKLHDFLENQEEDVCLASFRSFARITGRNVKTVKDWADKGFLKMWCFGDGACVIDLYGTEEKLKKISGTGI